MFVLQLKLQEKQRLAKYDMYYEHNILAVCVFFPPIKNTAAW